MSRRRLTLTARARTDVARIRLWYARVRPELAERFVEDVDALFYALIERPSSFPQVQGDVRRGLCDRFPYKVYFRVRPDEVRVLAVYHVSRHPR